MALNKLNFRKHSQQLRVALAGILALALVLGTGVQSHATTPDGAYIYHIKGNDLFIGSGASSERKPAALKNQLRGNTILYVPAGKRGSAYLGFIVDAPFDSAGLLVQAGPHNVASQWSFPCTASGGFKLAWKQGGERGCEEGVRMKRSGSQRSRLTLPNDQGLLAAKDILKAQADAEEVIVAPPSSESSVAQVYESANGIEVETVQGNILVKSAKNPQGRLISEGQRYSYPQDTTAPIDRNAILQTPEMQDFLNPSNWSSPDIPQRISDSIAGQLGQHRTALGLPSQPVASRPGTSQPTASGSSREQSGDLVNDPAFTVENNTDRNGSDYRSFDLSEARPELCQAACANDSRCQAFTYVKAGYYGRSQPSCWLKEPAPPPTPAECCISGIRASRSGTSQSPASSSSREPNSQMPLPKIN